MRATGEAELNGFDDGVDRAIDGFEGADGDADGLGQCVEAQSDFGDDAERAFGADEEAGEVVAGGGFAGAGAGVDDASVGEDDGEAEDVFAHGAVIDGGGPGGAGGGHAAERGVCTGIDEEGEAGVVEALGHTACGLIPASTVASMSDADAENPVHLPHVQTDASLDGVHVALERSAGAEGNHREPVTGHWTGENLADLCRGCGGKQTRSGRPGGCVLSPWL